MHPRSTRDLLASSEAATADPPTRDAAVDTKGGSAKPASVRGAQRRWPGTAPNQPSAIEAYAGYPDLVLAVIASPEEVLRAREIREQLRKKYLDRPSKHCFLWSVGID